MAHERLGRGFADDRDKRELCHHRHRRNSAHADMGVSESRGLPRLPQPECELRPRRQDAPAQLPHDVSRNWRDGQPASRARQHRPARHELQRSPARHLPEILRAHEHVRLAGTARPFVSRRELFTVPSPRRRAREFRRALHHAARTAAIDLRPGHRLSHGHQRPRVCAAGPRALGGLQSRQPRRAVSNAAARKKPRGLERAPRHFQLALFPAARPGRELDHASGQRQRRVHRASAVHRRRHRVDREPVSNHQRLRHRADRQRRELFAHHQPARVRRGYDSASGGSGAGRRGTFKLRLRHAGG